MITKNKYLLASIVLFVICFITWQVTGALAENTSDMDSVTSFAIFSFLGTVLFLLITLVLLLITVVSKFKNNNLNL
ncbi:hypothetical protein DYI25_18435 [Mesobacillus boroniphilus]|uniref:DUF3955 domain-containing protein n=1 Tax=Mesobacillus boroniphilus TaxID=308892 RepID=A0A944CPD6_9BACI|nr:hypothetical protein [Mesobacillus boroniphilus]